MVTVLTSRPAATVSNNWTIVDTTAHGATSDDSDATRLDGEIVGPNPDQAVLGGDTLALPADHEWHRARVRLRGAGAVDGPSREETRVQLLGDRTDVSGDDVSQEFTFVEIATKASSWELLPTPGAVGSAPVEFTLTAASTHTAEAYEIYYDREARNKPTFTPDVEDGAGSSVAGGTITDTNQARLVFGSIAYDGLVARSWTVEVEDSGGAIVFSDSGSGTPPPEIVTDPLADDTYTARFQAFSTIRVDDAFGSDVESVTFAVSFAPPNAPECTVTPTADPPSIEACWTDPTSPGFSPGDTEWDDESEVVSEVRRTDCNGTEVIYVALTYEDCHVDRFMGLSFAGSFCGEDDHVCQVCYEVRWWGRVDGIIVTTEWSAQCCVASIDNPEPGCDWLRGASSGDICVCTDRSYERTRPFGSFQPIGGGLPTVVTGTPGGRNYTLSFPVESEADLELVEAILDQPLNYFQPDDQRDLWMAPNPESVNVTKIKRLRVVQASFVEVEPNPLADPSSLVPPASGSP